MRAYFLFSAALAVIAAPLAAQIALPGVAVPRASVPGVPPIVDGIIDGLDETNTSVQRTAERLARDRLRAIDRLVRRNPGIVERDARGDPARHGELLVMDASLRELDPALAAGFRLLSEEQLEGLDLSVMRVGVPAGMKLADAEQALSALLPQAEISADHIHTEAGTVNTAVVALSAQGSPSVAVPVGMIDGAPGQAVKVLEIRGFAAGAPYPSHHGSSVASLLASAGASTVRVADVYGTDKAGGNALAIARGLGWLVSRGSKVVTISLVGPRNPVLERAIGAAQRGGVIIVAAVGNDGPAAPPAYPASYKGVVAVTGVDGKRRALIEAGRALHLDYAAPGADIFGRNARGKRIALRGTSFAAPLVAARAALAIGQGRNWRSALDSEAVDLGAQGRDDTFGNGLVCGTCTGR
ncbi:S8 family serine peptidase [Allopontixanthobacter sp.]|uniref:S8 family serine peptidase n=1 Tax=Allopontixanthobacter sp. TaxID=2906452 RepID=UPI002ABC4D94|nr:S8 family serine peptidase [Allopontixanthobacter sp.]MDZ4308292.1 S8 family serine peptidase [Allopontixanthobacter sp.]